jgi:endonuclease IV
MHELLGNFEIGYASSSPCVSKKAADGLDGHADFIEIPVHDDYLSRGISASVPDWFKGFVTLHGEGETGGRRLIQFSARRKQTRSQYAENAARLFNNASQKLGELRTRAVVVHPATLSHKYSRENQIDWFAESLSILCDSCVVPEICVEPRGGDRQRKVVRSEIQDILSLREALSSNGVQVGYCIDLAQTYCTHGMEAVVDLVRNCISHDLPIKEFHASDVAGASHSNRLGMEIGTGRIHFACILGEMRELRSRLLIETIGGLPVFRRSLECLRSLEAVIK